MRQSVKFLRDGEVVELDNVDPNETLLDYLRLREGSCGTKEGCGEGDCGACSVAIGSLKDGKLEYQAVNSCIQLLGMMDGKEIITVDDLSDSSQARRSGELHPVQDAMLRHHGSQCGFCTPGIVMSLFTLYHAEIEADRNTINDQLAGNLCRCTGYRPIIDAALESCTGKAEDRFREDAKARTTKLNELDDKEDLFIGNEAKFFAAPASTETLASLYEKHPDAVIVAGATDVGLWITKQLRDLPKIIHIGRVTELQNIIDNKGEIIIGAGVTYAHAKETLATIDPDVAEIIRRIGSTQVRASGTIGGNIANGSPIGDSPPLLIALNARLTLQKGTQSREIDLENFFIDYGKQDRKEGEFVSKIRVPKLAENEVFRSYKISKRFDQDISALLAAFRLTLDNSKITQARIAYGGMAGTPKRAELTQKALIGIDLNAPETWENAVQTLEQDFTPLSDMRASADYRMEAAKGLLIKALHEISNGKVDQQGKQTRVIGARANDVREAV
ncbi:FAD-binding molybdopterin dehydrogenase [Kiloniella litopenaei]|uniref:FAD-binding molybdopterin dehydrogenase n=1 Tax=Kiloniella litopenaei TaxID=1549748 RepID=A0A0M2RDM9_9PROT|nr:xanthine dehydrogenase small subunit [Kiloniella litopenaei]KKJ78564.1 FAD-binding molybdopterin dehydrogenase [Kiloniella litopenaei]